ncbi:LGFP repeat-containing protein [Gordonia sp. VNK21]|uniref:LGFP repeat-containing protein n=1 Tax=Gordonia sp. VNK21 TaxID=3382483 RepID=UPI0038D4BFDC
MRHIAGRRTAGIVAALAVTTLVAAGCSDDNDNDKDKAASSVASAVTGSEGASTSAGEDGGGVVTLDAADGSKVELTGPIAGKYAAATEAQKKDLGKPMTGDDAAGTSDSGVVFQQFDGGVISAANGTLGTPAYITWGKIRDAWNVDRAEDGQPSDDGKGGSDGPLGAATSDETTDGDMKKSTFENGEITYDTKTDKVTVTVDGKTVDTE